MHEWGRASKESQSAEYVRISVGLGFAQLFQLYVWTVWLLVYLPTGQQNIWTIHQTLCIFCGLWIQGPNSIASKTDRKTDQKPVWVYWNGFSIGFLIGFFKLLNCGPVAATSLTRPLQTLASGRSHEAWSFPPCRGRSSPPCRGAPSALCRRRVELPLEQNWLLGLFSKIGIRMETSRRHEWKVVRR